MNSLGNIEKGAFWLSSTVANNFTYYQTKYFFVESTTVSSERRLQS